MRPTLLGFAVLFPAAALAQTTELISVSSSGIPGDLESSWPSISADANRVVFASWAKNLVPNDPGGVDVFLRDRVAGTTTLISENLSGVAASGFRPSISADGRFVAFFSSAGDLGVGGAWGINQVVVRDVQLGVTTYESRSTAGVLGDAQSYAPTLSSDGRYVAFHSNATNLVASDTNGFQDVFVRDRLLGVTSRVSVSTIGREGDANSTEAAISGDGRYVAFESFATTLVDGDTNAKADVFVHDHLTGATTCASAGLAGVPGAGTSGSAALSADGRFVAFGSTAPDLVAGDDNGVVDVFVRDLTTGALVRANLTPSGNQSWGGASSPSLSADGRHVAFRSSAQDLGFGTQTSVQIFVRDTLLGVNRLMSVDSNGQPAQFASSDTPRLSADGRVAAFRCYVPLVPSDVNGTHDIYLRDESCSNITSYCTAKTNSLGCTPVISLSGLVSASSGSGATLSASNVLGVKPGVFFHGVGAPTAMPFHGGWLCMKPPLKRHAVIASGGTSGACDGSYTEDLNAYIASGADPALVAGATLGLQCWSRDPSDPSGFGDGLTSAVHATVCP